MFPAQALTDPARAKREIRFRIARERLEFFTATAAAVRPLRWPDRIRVRWLGAPAVLNLATVPVAFLLKRTLFPGNARRTPLVWRIARAVRRRFSQGLCGKSRA
jgi:hypothetical protein